MADTIRLKAGNKADMPDLADREPGYVRDEQALYIGTPEGNVKLGAGSEGKVKVLEEKVKILEEKAKTLGEKDTALEARIGSLENRMAGVELDMPGKLAAAPAASLTALGADADTAAIAAAYNALLDAMKAAGLMSN